MSQRSIKYVEAPRPLKSRSQHQVTTPSSAPTLINNKNLNNNNNNNNNYMLIEELIQLIENVAATLASGICSQEAMLLLLQNLRIHGPQLESVSKDTLDRSFVTFRNASQDERLNIMTRLNLLELIELRAKSWKDDGINTYYKHKAANNVEPDNTIILEQSSLGTSPQNFIPASSSVNVSNVGLQQQQQLNILGPGEIIRNSGKFTKPTKIPGKNYSKDEVVIRNADSGKVMGIKGRRVHMIEELSETIISFQRVNPGAKERLVQITGPNEDKINLAKQLIEDTIRRNASPVPLERATTGTGGNGGSNSSLASSTNSDEVTTRAVGATNFHQQQHAVIQHNRNSIGAILAAQQQQNQSANLIGTNFISNQAQIIQQQQQQQQQAPQLSLQKLRINQQQQQQQQLLHSFSTNDATLGEYKYTVNVGQHLIKITGDCCELVRAAKLVLDDYFSSNEFLVSVEAGAALDYSSTPTTPMSSGVQYATGTGQLITQSPFVDSGVGLNYMGGQITNSGNSSAGVIDGDDDVFIIEENDTTTPVNNLSRSRRSHFSRKDSTPENAKIALETSDAIGSLKQLNENVRIVHEYERLIYYAKSPHSWSLPIDWQKICEKHPSLIRNKDINDQTNRFDADKYLALIKSGPKRIIIDNADDVIDNE